MQGILLVKDEGIGPIELNELNKLNSLQMVLFNIRSIFHKLPIIVHDFVLNSMDIIGFCETWLSNATPDSLVSIPGYSIVRNNRLYGRGGGVASI